MMENLNYWRFIALIGTILFIYSAFLPLISIQIWMTTSSISLIDFYSIISIYARYGDITPQPWWPTSQPWWPKELNLYFLRIGIGFFLTMVLFPLTTVFGFISLIDHKLALFTGIFGIICWSGSIWGIYELKSFIAQMPLFGTTILSMIQFGTGIFTGMLGAGILITSYFIGAHEAKIKGT